MSDPLTNVHCRWLLHLSNSQEPSEVSHVTLLGSQEGLGWDVTPVPRLASLNVSLYTCTDQANNEHTVQ